MKMVIACLMCLLICTTGTVAQFKSDLDRQSASSFIRPTTSINSLLGLLNADNFMMRHSFSLNYLSSGGSGISLASYTNSMFFKLSGPLQLRFDVSLQGSPLGSYGAFDNASMSRVLLSNAELNYRPSENMFIRLQYSQVPYGHFYNDRRYAPSLFGDE